MNDMLLNRGSYFLGKNYFLFPKDIYNALVCECIISRMSKYTLSAILTHMYM